jgi:hypothetical protein
LILTQDHPYFGINHNGITIRAAFHPNNFDLFDAYGNVSRPIRSSRIIPRDEYSEGNANVENPRYPSHPGSR